MPGTFATLWPRLNRALDPIRPPARPRDRLRGGIVLQAEEVEEKIPIHRLPGQDERIRGATIFTPLATELAVLRDPVAVHAPVIRFTIRDCLVSPRGVSALGRDHLRIHKGAYPRAFGPVREVGKVAFATSNIADLFFGHWLRDACATALLREADEALWLPPKSAWPHAAQYTAAFGYEPLADGAVFASEVALYQDHGQGSLKRRRYAEMRRRLLAAAGTPAQAGPRRAYLRRGTSGARRSIRDEDRLIAALEREGFAVIEPAGMTLGAIVHALRDAETVVSMDGSHLNHLYFVSSKAPALVILMPEDRFTMAHVGYCQANGMRYGFVICERAGEDYAVDPRDVLATVDLTTR